MCRCLKVSRSGYYAWLGREPSRTVRRRKELSALIEWVFNSSRGTYGYRRTHAALARRGVETSLDTVRSIMRSQGLEAAQPRRKDSAPPSRPPGPGLAPRPGPAGLPPPARSEVGGRYHLYPHLGGVRVPGDRPGLLHEESSRVRHWGDSTRHRLRCARRSIWRPAGARTQEERRYSTRTGGASTPPSSSPGTWRATAFALRWAGPGCAGTMPGRKSAGATLKNERVYQMVYPTRSKAIRDIASWIELEYNQKRLHSALGYRTPNEVEEEHRAVRQAA